ncbi:MAG: GntR family transcriptional regulator [Thermoflavifilum sp.]|nr:GntR family transcriptional regulator [Thermoflavifilum sp.]MCL6514113.1 GntR family transcriptional regulator [Alicyclobacillus sp.]
MWLRVDPRLSTPVYQQVMDGIKAAIASGWLKPGDKLPSVRELALELTINHNTVAKAYQELERERVIEVIRGRGTFVAYPGERRPPDLERRVTALRDEMRRIWVEAYHLGLRRAEVMAMFEAAHGDQTSVSSEEGGEQDGPRRGGAESQQTDPRTDGA